MLTPIMHTSRLIQSYLLKKEPVHVLWKSMLFTKTAVLEFSLPTLSLEEQNITYFKNLDDTIKILDQILASSEAVTVSNSLKLADKLISEFKDKVYFFNGEDFKSQMRKIFKRFLTKISEAK